jgi:predicted flap endonuclease-1-like 5' DNA nuclease
MEIKKLSEQELQQINQLRQDFANAYAAIGSAQSRIREIEVENHQNFAVLEQIKQKEAELFDQLKNIYGIGTVDLETGEFKPSEE